MAENEELMVLADAFDITSQERFTFRSKMLGKKTKMIEKTETAKKNDKRNYEEKNN